MVETNVTIKVGAAGAASPTQKVAVAERSFCIAAAFRAYLDGLE
jgi:hypothetical protein